MNSYIKLVEINIRPVHDLALKGIARRCMLVASFTPLPGKCTLTMDKREHHTNLSPTG